jgi:hypothetical protein
MTLAALILAAGTVQAASNNVREPSCSDNLTCSKCVYIDLFDSAHSVNAPAGSPWILPDINGGKGVTVGTLVNGQTYLITVTGWVSYWFKSVWDAHSSVGIPVDPPKHYSDAPGAPLPADQARTGYDWRCLFAYPQFPGVPVVALPSSYHSERVSLDGGVTYGELEPLGGMVCAPDHTYRFLVVGKGLQAYFRISDTGPTYDNYGKYKICVQAVCCTTEDCKDLVPPAEAVSRSLMVNGVFDPRVITGPTEK